MKLLDRAPLERALDLARRAYRLMLWLGDAVERGFIAHEAAHLYASGQAGARAWVEKHYDNIPPDARPARADVRDFCNVLETFRTGSLDLEADPAPRGSPSVRSCTVCYWLLREPRVRTKKPTSRDRSRARKMLADAVRRAALVEDVALTGADVDAIVDAPDMREPVALLAYGCDIQRRLGGVSAGPAQLVLWRRFAWKLSGSPKKDFELTADLILAAEDAVRIRVRSTTRSA